jgi:hypothetical protein
MSVISGKEFNKLHKGEKFVKIINNERKHHVQQE